MMNGKGYKTGKSGKGGKSKGKDYKSGGKKK
jgi:hypothetical protein